MRTENTNCIRILRVGICPQIQSVEAPTPKLQHEQKTNAVDAFVAHSSKPDKLIGNVSSEIIPRLHVPSSEFLPLFLLACLQ
jgi:hypothetical protein